MSRKDRAKGERFIDTPTDCIGYKLTSDIWGSWHEAWSPHPLHVIVYNLLETLTETKVCWLALTVCVETFYVRFWNQEPS